MVINFTPAKVDRQHVVIEIRTVPSQMFSEGGRKQRNNCIHYSLFKISNHEVANMLNDRF